MMITLSNKIAFIISENGEMLNIDNLIFKLNKMTSTGKYYRCGDPDCTVTVHTDLEDIILNTKCAHCHPSSLSLRSVARSLEKK